VFVHLNGPRVQGANIDNRAGGRVEKQAAARMCGHAVEVACPERHAFAFARGRHIGDVAAGRACFTQDIGVQALSHLERVAAIPGVQYAAFAWGVPLTGNNWPATMDIEGQPPAAKESDKIALPMRAATPDYFKLMGLGLIDGREFRSTDDNKAPNVAIVNQAFTHRYFPNSNSVGRKIWFRGREKPGIQIVGEIANARTDDLTQEPSPEVYLQFHAASGRCPDDYYAVYCTWQENDPRLAKINTYTGVAEIGMMYRALRPDPNGAALDPDGRPIVQGASMMYRRLTAEPGPGRRRLLAGEEEPYAFVEALTAGRDPRREGLPWPGVRPAAGEVALVAPWQIHVAAPHSPPVDAAVGDLVDFLRESMRLRLPVVWDPAARPQPERILIEQGHEFPAGPRRAAGYRFLAGDGGVHPDILRFGFTPLYIGFEDVWHAVAHLQQVLDSGQWQRAEFMQKQAVT